MDIDNFESIGCILFGNDNDVEVMRDEDACLIFIDHNEDPDDPSSYMFEKQFLAYIADNYPQYLAEVLEQLDDIGDGN